MSHLLNANPSADSVRPILRLSRAALIPRIVDDYLIQWSPANCGNVAQLIRYEINSTAIKNQASHRDCNFTERRPRCRF